MKILTHAVVAVVFLVLGAVLAAFIGKVALPNAMFKEFPSDLNHEETVALIQQRITDADGWVVVATIDQRQAILNGGGPDIGPYDIVKFCNAHYAGRMLEDDDRRFFGVGMPISVAIYEKSDGRTYISLVNGTLTSRLFGGELAAVVTDVRFELEEMLQPFHVALPLF